eukprot:2543713-Amphidinium_carterae.1
MSLARLLYQKVAKRGSILYFAMSGMVAISEMYEFSLGSYLGVFMTALKEAKVHRDGMLPNFARNGKHKK